MHTHTHADTRTLLSIPVYTHIHLHTPAHPSIYSHKPLHTRAYPRIPAHTHTHLHTPVHNHTYPHTHTKDRKRKEHESAEAISGLKTMSNHLLVEPRYYHSDGSKITLFPGHGSTTVVAVKNQVQLKKLRIAKFIQKWKKKNLLSLPWYYHGHGSSVILLPSPW